MNKTNAAILGALILGTAVGCVGHGQTFADSACADLRAARPKLTRAIGVTCRAPERTTYFGCSPLNGDTGASVDAVMVDAQCAHPWGV